jgi:hypothetical protein
MSGQLGGWLIAWTTHSYGGSCTRYRHDPAGTLFWSPGDLYRTTSSRLLGSRQSKALASSHRPEPLRSEGLDSLESRTPYAGEAAP